MLEVFCVFIFAAMCERVVHCAMNPPLPPHHFYDDSGEKYSSRSGSSATVMPTRRRP
jgi:hypothetical protein